MSSTAWQIDQMHFFFSTLGSTPSTVDVEINPAETTSRYDGSKIILAPFTKMPDIPRHEYSHFMVWDIYGPNGIDLQGIPAQEGQAMDEGIADFHAGRSSRDSSGKSDRRLLDPFNNRDLDEDRVHPTDWDTNNSTGHENSRIVSSMLWDLIKVDPFEPEGDTLAFPHGFDYISWDALRIDQPTDFASLREALERIAAYWGPTYVQRVHEVCEAHGIQSTVATFYGHIGVDVNWSNDIQLIGDVIVDPGVTLSIDPGTTLTFVADSDALGGGNNPAQAELIVDGWLTANGVTFESTSGAVGSWGGILIQSQNTGLSNTFTNCTIRDATRGIQMLSPASSMTIDQSNIFGSSSYGIDASNATITVSNSYIYSNGDTGIYMYNSSNGTVDNTQVHDNAPYGIEVDSSNLTVRNNTHIYNHSHSAYIHGTNVSVSLEDSILENSFRVALDSPGSGIRVTGVTIKLQ